MFDFDNDPSISTFNPLDEEPTFRFVYGSIQDHDVLKIFDTPYKEMAKLNYSEMSIIRIMRLISDRDHCCDKFKKYDYDKIIKRYLGRLVNSLNKVTAENKKLKVRNREMASTIMDLQNNVNYRKRKSNKEVAHA